jgi:hypothetical protein
MSARDKDDPRRAIRSLDYSVFLRYATGTGNFWLLGLKMAFGLVELI